eukprot:9349577-Pyramimonas_sp.AAC.1
MKQANISRPSNAPRCPPSKDNEIQVRRRDISPVRGLQAWNPSTLFSSDSMGFRDTGSAPGPFNPGLFVDGLVLSKDVSHQRPRTLIRMNRGRGPMVDAHLRHDDLGWIPRALLGWTIA